MDVTNATHNFLDQEWQRLRGHYDFINQRREHANWRGRGGPTILLEAGSAARGWGRNSDVISVLQQASSIQSEITANMNPRTDMQGADDGNGGNSFGVASYGGQKIHFENQGRWGPRTMSKTLHRLIEAYVQHGPILQPIPHALLQIVRYTSTWTPVVLVQNFIPIYLTGKFVMFPFCGFHTQTKQCWDLLWCYCIWGQDRNAVILIISKALWMGDKLQQSLINPYQISSADIQLCDNTTDKNRPFGMQANGLQIPFKMAGLTCIFPTRTSTQWELENCLHVELPSDLEWNPKGVYFGYYVADVDSGDSATISTDISNQILALQYSLDSGE